MNEKTHVLYSDNKGGLGIEGRKMYCPSCEKYLCTIDKDKNILCGLLKYVGSPDDIEIVCGYCEGTSVFKPTPKKD